MSRRFCGQSDTPIPENQYNADGKYRWPFGLPVISAERFPGKPDLSAVLDSYLSGTQWAAYALDVQFRVKLNGGCLDCELFLSFRKRCSR